MCNFVDSPSTPPHSSIAGVRVTTKKAKRYLFGLFNRQQSSTLIISAWAAVDKLFIGNFSLRICFTLRDTIFRADYFKATRNYNLSIGNAQ